MQIPGVVSSFPTAAWSLPIVDLASDAFDPARRWAFATPKGFFKEPTYDQSAGRRGAVAR
jgi:hypothetical protein